MDYQPQMGTDLPAGRQTQITRNRFRQPGNLCSICVNLWQPK
jgi:hypothetical protein